MVLVKKFLRISILGLFLFGNTQQCLAMIEVKKSEQTITYVNNVIELLDSGSEESFYNKGGGGAFGVSFNAALDQQSACIVVSGVILHAWLNLIRYFEEEQKKSNILIGLCSHLRKEYFKGIYQRELEEKNEKDEKLQKKIESIDEKLQKFNLKKSILNKKLSNETNKKIEDKIKKLEDKKKFLDTEKNVDRWTLVSQYYCKHKNSFITDKQKYDDSVHSNNRKLEQAYQCFLRKNKLTAWNIFYNSPADVFLFTPKSVTTEKIKEFFAINNSSILKSVSIKELPALVKQWDSLQNPMTLLWQSLTKSVSWKELKKIYQPDSKGWVFVHGGHGMYTHTLLSQKTLFTNRLSTFDPMSLTSKYAKIAGLSVPDALDRATFLGTTIKTLATIDFSCFGGGRHATLLAKHLNKLEQNNKNFKPYSYIIEALTDSVTSADGYADVVDFDTFFTTIRTSNFDKTSFGKALSYIKDDCRRSYDDLNGVNGLSLIRLPQEKRFTPFANNRTLLYDKTFDDKIIKIFNKNAILLQSPHLKTIIKITPVTNYAPTICSLLPGEVVHEIDSIISRYNINALLRDLFFSIREASEKVFIIRSLCIKDLEYKGILPQDGESIILENVIIHKGYSLKAYGLSFDGTMKMLGKVYCKAKGKDAYFKAILIDNYDKPIREAILQDFISIPTETFKTILKETESLINIS